MYIYGDAMREKGGSGREKNQETSSQKFKTWPPIFLDLTPRSSAVPRPPLALPPLPDSSLAVPRSLRLSLRRSFLTHY